MCEPGWVEPELEPGFWAGGGVVEPVLVVPVEPVPVVWLPVEPVPVEPVPVEPLPVVPVPVEPLPVVPVPVEPLPVVPVPVEVPPGGSLLGMRYDRGAAKGMSPDWPNVAITAPLGPINCPVLGRNTTG
jgi:hypothetical protein